MVPVERILWRCRLAAPTFTLQCAVSHYIAPRGGLTPAVLLEWRFCRHGHFSPGTSVRLWYCRVVSNGHMGRTLFFAKHCDRNVGIFLPSVNSFSLCSIAASVSTSIGSARPTYEPRLISLILAESAMPAFPSRDDTEARLTTRLRESFSSRMRVSSDSASFLTFDC